MKRKYRSSQVYELISIAYLVFLDGGLLLGGILLDFAGFPNMFLTSLLITVVLTAGFVLLGNLTAGFVSDGLGFRV